jgi:hypothetical protein
VTPQAFIQNALTPALGLLPPSMDSKPARAMVLAICLQESRLKHRKQINGPARGYPQFELGGGITGVLTHPASKPHIQTVLNALDYDMNAGDCYTAIAHNDILAAAFARLLLYTLPELLPVRSDPDGGWRQYIKAWRPGKPHRESWDTLYAQAWATLEAA